MPADSREILQSDWHDFLDAFSRTHKGRRAIVQFVGEQVGVQTIACNLPLMGITFDNSGDGKPQIQVIIGDSTDAHVMHVVRSPSRLWVTKMFNGEDRAIKIETLGGDYLLIDFGQLSHAA